MRPLLTEQDASERLGLSVRTLQKWRLQGSGPRFIKLGAAVRYDPTDLDEYIERGRRRSTSDPERPRDGQQGREWTVRRRERAQAVLMSTRRGKTPQHNEIICY
jgi:predicted DNA-binding transcriptional regulator AlpA